MTLPLDDRGLTLGDGLFETLLWEEGGLVFWPEHFDRLVRGCKALGLPAPAEADALAAARAAGETLGAVRGAVRLTLTAGSGGRGLDRPARLLPHLNASAAPAALPSGPAAVVAVSIRRNDASPASRLKTLSYLDNVLARREAVERGADEALMLNTRGEVACAAAANIVWLKDGMLFTPALDCGVLDGVIRGALMRAQPVAEVHADLDAVLNADAVYLTNSLMGLRPVVRLEGRSFLPGPNYSSFR